MRALVVRGPGVPMALEDLPTPVCGEGDVLVRVKAAAICGSDIHMYHWTPFAEKIVKCFPFTPGHEGSGVVIACGSGVRSLRVGDRVAFETHIPCGYCYQCCHGNQHICKNMHMLGHDVNGCFAELCVAPECAVRKVPERLSDMQAALLEPAGVALRGPWEARETAGSIVVIGCGPIGLFAIAGARALGLAPVVGVDVNETRLGLARQVGATHAFDSRSLTSEVLELTGGDGVGAVVEASGAPQAIKQAFHYLRKGGTIYLLGHPPERVDLDLSADVILKEAAVQGFHGRRMWESWDVTERLLLSGAIPSEVIVTHTFPLDRFEEAFNTASGGQCGKVGLVFK